MAHIKQFEHLKIQLETIKSATKNFSNENLIGQGGFGKVYKGEIEHSEGQQSMVALKRLDRKFGQGEPEFWKEIMLLSFYRHENIVSLLGYCDHSGERILAYEYASKKSLDLYLNNNELTWVRRLKICIGAARGLAYLHTPVDTQLRVLHRDIKSSNILLDENWNAKIADFGLSKFAPTNKQFTYLISNAVGTLGYCDPLYVESGLLTKESDVYSFGVVLFEVLCGRLCIDNNDGKSQPLLGLVRDCHEEDKLNEIICSKIKDEINPFSLKDFVTIAYRCLKKNREERPLMTEIVTALESALKCQCSDAGNKGEGERTRIAGILNVKVIRGMDFRKGINPYVILGLTEDYLNSKRKTCVHHGSMDPEWNEEFTLYVESRRDQSLEINVQNAASVEMHDEVGFHVLGLRNVTSEDTIHLFSHTHKEQAKLTVEMVYTPFAYYTAFEDVCQVQKAPTGTPQGGGLLVIIIHQAFGLQKKHHYNPYASFLFRGKSRKTVSIKKTNYPLWEEEFPIMLEEPPSDEEELHLEVVSTPWRGLIYRKEESMGHAHICVGDVVNKKRINKRYDLENGSGWVQVELQWRTSD